MGNNSIIISIIIIENLKYQKATFYNGVTAYNISSKRYMKYTGILQAEAKDAYFIFETDDNSFLEKVLIQVQITDHKTDKYYAYIASECCSEKCILLDKYIDNKKALLEITKDLKLTTKEWDNLKENQYWSVDISHEREIRNKI